MKPRTVFVVLRLETAADIKDLLNADTWTAMARGDTHHEFVNTHVTGVLAKVPDGPRNADDLRKLLNDL